MEVSSYKSPVIYNYTPFPSGTDMLGIMVKDVYQVDPLWLSHIFSLPSFISFLVALVCCYVISPLLVSHLIPKAQLQQLPRKKMQLMYTLLGSTVHAVVVTLFASYVLASGSLSRNRVFSYSPDGYAVLQITLGYATADFIICILDPYLRTMPSILAHHVGMIAGISMCFYHRLYMFFVVYRLLSEFSTPFVNMRLFVCEIGDKRSWWYVIASCGMIFSFFLCRILVIPWHTYGLIVSFISTAANIPTYLLAYMVLNFGTFDVLNVYWFYKMVKGGLKYYYQRSATD